MFNGKTFLAIIPARGGSKRLPRKNVLNLAGKPLIAWTLEAAKKAIYLDKIVVSSDDSEILKISAEMEIDTIVRPAELASDTASTFDSVEHAIKNIGTKFDYIVLLQPTSPLRTEVHINEAIELLFEKSADAIISICESEHPPLWSNILPSDGSLANFIPEEVRNKRSQDLPRFYRLNGAIYICSVNRALEKRTLLLPNNIYGYIMPLEKSIDIDNEVDFLLAKTLIQKV